MIQGTAKASPSVRDAEVCGVSSWLFICWLPSSWHILRHRRPNLPGTMTRPFASTCKQPTISYISSVLVPHLRKASSSGKALRRRPLKGLRRLKGLLMYLGAIIKPGVYQLALDSRLQQSHWLPLELITSLLVGPSTPYSYRSLIFLEEQFYVLKRGCSVNNLFFPMWDDALPFKSTADVYLSVRNHLANNLLTSSPQRSRWTT